MKAVISNTLNVGDLSLTLQTALFARKRVGKWRVHLNYHRLTVRILDKTNESYHPMLDGLSIQTSRDNDWTAVAASLLGVVGVAIDAVKLVKQAIKTLADVRSLIPKVLDWLQAEALRVINGQEPAYQSKLEQAQFVLNLFKDGVSIERRSPRWRQRENL